MGYSVNFFDGLGGQLSTSTVPPAYQQANSLMGEGTGNVLSLPWHLYMAYPFTAGRVVANIAPTVFDRPVISGDNVEAGPIQSESTSPRSAYIEGLLAHSQEIRHFGTLVTPLGVQYVTLAKATDWTKYQWLNHQTDLALVLDTPALEVWRNLDFAGVGMRVTDVVRVASVQDLISASNSPNSTNIATILVGGSGNLFHQTLRDARSSQHIVNVKAPPTVTEVSPVAYAIAPGHAGWVEVSAPYQKGWSLGGRSALSTSQGTLLVQVGAHGGVLRFTPWSVVRLSYFLSVLAIIGLVFASLWARRRRQYGS